MFRFIVAVVLRLLVMFVWRNGTGVWAETIIHEIFMYAYGNPYSLNNIYAVK